MHDASAVRQAEAELIGCAPRTGGGDERRREGQVRAKQLPSLRPCVRPSGQRRSDRPRVEAAQPPRIRAGADPRGGAGPRGRAGGGPSGQGWVTGRGSGGVSPGTGVGWTPGDMVHSSGGRSGMDFEKPFGWGFVLRGHGAGGGPRRKGSDIWAGRRGRGGNLRGGGNPSGPDRARAIRAGGPGVGAKGTRGGHPRGGVRVSGVHTGMWGLRVTPPSLTPLFVLFGFCCKKKTLKRRKLTFLDQTPEAPTPRCTCGSDTSNKEALSVLRRKSIVFPRRFFPGREVSMWVDLTPQRYLQHERS